MSVLTSHEPPLWSEKVHASWPQCTFKNRLYGLNDGYITLKTLKLGFYSAPAGVPPDIRVGSIDRSIGIESTREKTTRNER